jgi:hypothetical protein
MQAIQRNFTLTQPYGDMNIRVCMIPKRAEGHYAQRDDFNPRRLPM